MSEQAVLGSLLAAAVAAHNLIMAAIFLAGLALAVWGWVRRRMLWSVIGLGIAISPVALFALNRSSADSRRLDREAEVRALPRERMPPDYPRQLLVEGDLAPATAISLIVLGYFDHVEIREGLAMAQRVALRERDAPCTASAHRWLGRDDRQLGRERPALAAALARCASVEAGAPWLPASADAVILRTADTARHRTKGRLWAGGVVEIVVRRADRERLIDYRERPYEERQVAITSPMAEPLPPPPALDATALLLKALAPVAQVQRAAADPAK